MEFKNKQIQVFSDTNFRVILSITLMAVLGVASISPVFPIIQDEFNVSKEKVSYLVTFFTLPGIFLTPFLGMLADRWGRKEVLVPSLMLFGIAGGLCALATSFRMLLILRFIQGIGGASLNSINITLIGDLYKGKTRAAAMGYNASILSIGTAIYPAIGGSMALLGWHYPFLLPLLAVPIGLLSVFMLRTSAMEKPQGLRQYFSEAWINMNDPRILTIFIIGMATFIILYGCYVSYFPFLINESFQVSSFTIGLLMSAMSLSTALTSSQLERLLRTFSKRQLLIMAFMLFSVALFLIPNMKMIYLLIIPVVLFGIALGLTVPNINTLLAELTPKKHRAILMSVNGMVLRTGQTLGPVIIGLVFTRFRLSATFYAGTILSLLMIPLLTGLLKKEPRREEGSEIHRKKN